MLRRLLKVLLKSPLRHVLFATQNAWTRWNDRRFNIETMHRNVGQGAVESLTDSELGHAGQPAAHNDAVEYGSVDYRNVQKTLDWLALTPDDVFVDIGCGKGRVLCLAARRNIKRAIGIELFDRLADASRANAERIAGRVSPVEVICGDATKADLSEGTVFFLYNPFGAETMIDVLANLKRSLDEKPRKIRICYFNPKQEHVYRQTPWLEPTGEFRTWGGTRVTFWRNRV